MQKRLDSNVRESLPLLTYPGLQITGKDVRDIVTSGEEQYRSIKVLAEQFSMLASVLVMDLSVEAEAFGAVISFAKDEAPTVIGKLIGSVNEIAELNVPEVGTGRTAEYLKCAELAAAHIKDRPVFAGMIGPLSLAGRLTDISEMMMMTLSDPQSAQLLLEKCTSFLTDYARRFKGTGAQGIIIAEPAAGLLSPDMCDSFSSHYVREIVEKVQDENFLVILHNCGNTEELVESMLSTGAKALHFGNAVDMTRILPQVPEGILVMGNIDPAGVLKNGNPETVKNAVLKLLEETKEYNNFILSSGCEIPHGTPLENITAFFNALEEFNDR